MKLLATNGVVNIKLPEVQNAISIRILDLVDQLVYNLIEGGRGEFATELDIPEGMNFVVITNDRNQKAILKFLKK